MPGQTKPLESTTPIVSFLVVWCFVMAFFLGFRFLYVREWPSLDTLSVGGFMRWATLGTLLIASIIVLSQESKYGRVIEGTKAKALKERSKDAWGYRAASLVLLVILGCMFKLIELRQLARSGLLPTSISVTNTFGSPNLQYLVAVRQRLLDCDQQLRQQSLLPKASQATGEGGSADMTIQQKIELVSNLLQNWVQWVAQEVASGEPASYRREMIRLLARDVLPMTVPVSVESEQTMKRNSVRMEKQQEDLELLVRELSASEELALQRLGNAPTAEARRELAFEVDRAQTEAARYRKELRELSKREELRKELDEATRGLNARYPWLHLPTVVPGGARWSWCYLLSNVVLLVAMLVGAWRCIDGFGDGMPVVAKLHWLFALGLGVGITW